MSLRLPPGARSLHLLVTAAIFTSLVGPSGEGTAARLSLAATTGTVVEQRVQYVDHTRSTVSHHKLLSRSRTLPTWLLLPYGSRPHPLIVFCHGYDVTPLTYAHLLRSWAKAGYIVAAPYFPLTNQRAGRWLDEGDLIHQPADAAFVLTEAERTLGSAVDSTHVFVAGHSDGGSTSFGSGFATSMRDRRWSGVLAFSGARSSSMGPFAAPPTPLPFLLIQSDHDEYNSLDEAAHVWAVPKSPKAYLHLLGARHLPPFSSANPYRDLVEATTTDFLRAWTATNRASRTAWQNRMDREGTRAHLSSVTDER